MRANPNSQSLFNKDELSMQIMPSSGGWTNAAASTQQALNDAKHSNTNSNRDVAADLTVNKLEQSGKTSDRDANERYDSPPSGNTNAGTAPSEANLVSDDSLLSLPALDELPPSTLDIMG